MSRILVDTSAYSAYMGGHPDLRDPVQQASEVCLNAVVIGELLAAFKKGTRTKQNEKRLHMKSASMTSLPLPGCAS